MNQVEVRNRERERIVSNVQDFLTCLMNQQGLTIKDIGNRLGWNDSYVDGVLTGRPMMTLTDLSDLYWAVGRRVRLVDEPLESAEADRA